MVLPLLGVLGSVVGAFAQGSAASSAAAAQERSAQAQVDLSRDQFEQVSRDFTPYREQGGNALAALLYNLGMGPRPNIGATMPQVTQIDDTFTPPTPPGTYFAGEPGMQQGHYDANGNRISGAVSPQTRSRFNVLGQLFDSREAAETYARENPTGGTPYGGFQASPGYEFAVGEGQRALDRSAASRGDLFSGRTAKATIGFGQGMANQEFNNYLNRLAGLTDMGMGAAGMQANASNAYVGQATNALSGMGNAQAAGAIGVGNAINSGIQNALGAGSYMVNATQNRAPANNSAWWLGRS